MKKKIIIMIAAVVLCIVALGGTTPNATELSYAKDAQITINVPDGVKKEDEFTVEVDFSSDVALYSVEAYLNYDPELLEFIPEEGAVTGAEGMIEIRDTFEQETFDKKYSLKFKALDIGETSIDTKEAYLVDYDDMDYMQITPSSNAFAIELNNTVAEDARLASLVVEPGTMTTEFDPNVLEYEVHIGLDVEQVGISSVPMDEGSDVELEMPDEIVDGLNIIRLTVTALSGNTNIYIIKVYRDQVPEEITTENASTEDAANAGSEEVTTEAPATQTSETEASASTEATTEVPAEVQVENTAGV